MFEKNEIMQLSEKDWKRKVFYDFSKDMTSKDPKSLIAGSNGCFYIIALENVVSNNKKVGVEV